MHPLLRSQCLSVFVGLLLLASASTGLTASVAIAPMIQRGEQFLIQLFDPKLDLLPEFAGATNYWLLHDNYLAAKALEPARPDLAARLRTSLARHGVTRSGKIEMLFNEAPRALPFFEPELVTVTELDGACVRTERATSRPVAGWDQYADLLLLKAMALAPTNREAARAQYERAVKFWDGHGLNDAATRHLQRYATYKLALLLLAAHRLDVRCTLTEPILERFAAMQGPQGGWITDYTTTGEPRGVANVETTSLVLLALRTLVQPASRPTASRPNFVFILADDLGYGDVGAFGQTKIRTPNLDRLAAEGMRFTRHYAGNAVCAPSRCVLLTGKHPGHAFIRNNREVQPEGQTPLPANEVTLPELLQAHGYVTGAFGKWGLGPPGSSGDPFQQGLDRFYGYNCQRDAHNYFPAFLYDDQRRQTLRNPAFAAHQALPPDLDPNQPASYERYRAPDYAPDLIMEQARAFVRQNRQCPFFLFIPTTVPHLALQVPEDSLASYRGQWPDPPYTGTNRYLPHFAPRAAYAAMISRLDQEIGRLVQLLRELDLERSTLIVFTSDNGPVFAGLGGSDSAFFNSAGGLRGRKGSLYEGGIRVPLIARWPGKVPAGSTADRVTGFEDWLPTLLELVRGSNAVIPGVDGISFAATLLGNSQPPRPFLYREFPASGGQQSLHLGDWKGIRQNLGRRGAAGKVPLELYHLAEDPAETRNRSREEPERVQAIERLMLEQHQRSALFPLPGIDGVPSN